MKKILALIMALSFCIIAASCVKQGNNESSTEPNTTVSTTTTGTSSESTSQTTQTTSTTTGEVIPPVAEKIYDIESEKVGDFVTVNYNADTCTVKTEVKKGVGSKQTVTITVEMRDGFIFDGISKDDAIVNNASKKVSSSLTYKFDASSETKIYVNTSMKIVYHTGDGKSSSGSKTFESTYALTGFHNPNTLPEKGYFVRDGYTLVEYNTKEDGSGTAVSLGGRVNAEGKAVLDLWCVWQKNTDESLFKYEIKNKEAHITGYAGNDEIVCIPETLGGATVTKITSDAFKNADMKKVIIAKTVKNVSSGAFTNCKELETVVVFDGSFASEAGEGGGWWGGTPGISEDSFEGCDNFKNFYVNSTFTLYNFWARYGANHLDRLMWAKDKKKIIIVGGSGSYYGYNCDIIKKALSGEYEIINFGENANISALIYFDIIEDFVGEGDILLWSPEPGYNTLGTSAIGSRAWAFRQNDYNFLRYIDRSDFTDLISRFSSFSEELQSGKFIPYDRFSTSTNKYGDDDEASREWDKNIYNYNFKYDVSAKEEMTALVKKLDEKGCSVYFTYAAMQKTGMEESKVTDQIIEVYTNKLKEIGVTVISDYKDCIYPDEYFYNSAWHMNQKGADARSENVANDLKKQLGK